MVTPRRRIQLLETEHGRLEILILGEPESIAREHAAIRTKLDAWQGWRNVAHLIMGTQAIGLRADVSNIAMHLDAIAEWWRMCRDDSGFLPHVQWRGPVGEW